MRTTELKINNEKRESVLVAGGQGFKIYTTSNYDGWVLALGRKIFTVDEATNEFKIIAKYINLRFQPINEQKIINSEFQAFLQTLKENLATT